jgi:rfaE bifunctional protein nucleotidyltransferase chain/domain
MVTLRVDSKIKNFDELCQITGSLKKEGKTVVHCHGVFDLLHPGHIRHFQAAKKEGDVLVVTVTRDIYVNKGPGRPAFNEQLRAESVAALSCVDFVAINEWPSAVETITRLCPDVYCKGNDYARAEEDLTGKISEEETAVAAVGGRLHLTDEITFSSSTLLNHHFNLIPDDAQDFIRQFREKYTSRDIITRMQGLKGLKVAIIGDTIVDEYHYCSPMGKSAKENLIPARFLYSETYAGGVLAIANHIAGFCDHVDLITCLGIQDTYEDFIIKNLKPNVTSKFFYHPSASTIIKRRFVEVDLLRKLFEVNFLDGNSVPEDVNRESCQFLESRAGGYDLAVIGDYGHGFIGREIIKILCGRSRFLAVNAQTNAANIGYNLITKYPRADYFCIDEPELRLATHDRVSKIEGLLAKVTHDLDCHKAVVTLGHRGSLIYDNSNGFVSVPAFSREVVDRMGAGDAFLSITSACVAAGFPMDMVGFIGNAVGALKIRIIGNKSAVDPVPLYKYITTLLK